MEIIMNKKIFFVLFCLFIFSRIIFINTKDVFFDSAENIVLLSSSNFIDAIISGHFPPHEGYITLFWPVFQAARFFHLNAVHTVIIGQIILACFTIYFFYKLVTFIIDKRTAL